MGPAVVSSCGFSHGEREDVAQFLDRRTGFKGTFEVFQDTGFAPALYGEGEAQKLVCFFIDRHLLFVESIDLVKFLSKFRKKLLKHPHFASQPSLFICIFS